MREFIVFAHAMVNFSHNRTAGKYQEKEAQERLIREQCGSRHNFLGAFDDSGNFAFLTAYHPAELKADVLTALNHEYRVEGAVVVERDRAAKALLDAKALCGRIYQDQFRARYNLVWKNCEPWRLGVVFMQELYEQRISYIEELLKLEDARLEILSLQDGFVKLLKFDPKEPRIPWGEAARTVENTLAHLGASWLATGRSARTVRGVLRKFTES